MKNEMSKLMLSMLSSFVLISGTYASDSWYIGAGYNGIAVKTDINKDFSIQVGYGGFGDIGGFRGRGIYKFKHNTDYALYGFGGIAYATDNVTSSVSGGYGTSATNDIDITTKGVEFGIGIDYDLRKSTNSNLPIFIDIEVGYRASSTDVEGTTTFDGYDSPLSVTQNANYDYSGVIAGIWIYYRF